MRKIWLGLVWLTSSSMTLMTGLVVMVYVFNWPSTATYLKQLDNQAVVVNKNAQQPAVKGLESSVELQDGRAQIVANFLQKYNSPLKPHDYFGQKLVEIADKYNLDFRFIPAVMMQESQLCKKIPEGSNNCLGFGIHSGGTLGFDTYEAGFERAARELRANYVEEGRIKVSEIARKYTASVDQWTFAVNQFMAEMEYDDRDMGIEKKTDANVLEYVK